MPGTSACARGRCSGRAGSASDGRASLPLRRARPCLEPDSTASGVSPGARPVRLDTRKTCVSTAMVGSPKATLSTTFAVLRPTPGSASSASRSRGTSPPCFSISSSRQRDDVLGLGVEQADGLDVVHQPLEPSATICCGVVDPFEQRLGRLVDADVGRLGRQHHGDQQRIGVDVFQLRLGLRHGGRQPGENRVGLRRASAGAPPCARARRAGRWLSAWAWPAACRRPCRRQPERP